MSRGDISWPVGLTWCASVLLSTVYLFFCPFTKVEESFNLQAIHDHIYHGLNTSQFDHRVFTGPLPRTFIGNLIVGYATAPFHLLPGDMPKICLQYTARLMLLGLVQLAYLHFLSSVKRLYGTSVAVWSCLTLCTQFHFLFYASRPLPNTFALIPALLATSCWLRSWHRGFIFYSGFAIIVFRCELALFFGLMLLISLVYTRLNICTLFLWVVASGLLSLGSTVLIDSFYWQQWVWPEGWAFYFNAVLNKSSEWGTSPFLWYFYSALPRCLGLSLLLAPLGMAVDNRCLMMCLPAFGFVLLYSLLPHKELRFIIYVVPLIDVAAARLCSIAWNNKRRSGDKSVLALVVAGHLLANSAMAALLFKVSYHNYPGGAALSWLNSQPSTHAMNIHIDVYSAQTGISRFLHEHSHWNYDKTEDEVQVEKRISSYDFLVRGSSDVQEARRMRVRYSSTHSVVHEEQCYQGLDLSADYPFIRVRLAACVWIFQNIKLL